MTGIPWRSAPARGRTPAGRRAAAVLIAALALTSCTGGEPTDPLVPVSSSSARQAEVDSTFTFGTPADPAGLDPAYALDSETFRITRQMFEGLVGVDPDTGSPTPSLATEWRESSDGRAYTFTLRREVTFHNGEPFNADAVCQNFDRWYNTPAEIQAAVSGLAFESVFRGFADTPAESLYEGCTAVTPFTVRINLQEPLTGFIQALTLPSFAISSPRALAELNPDQLTGNRNGFPISAYAEAPVGTGPFRFVSWEEHTVRLRAYDGYWGEQGDVRTVVFNTLARPESRLRALQRGDIDGYDLVTPASLRDLVRDGKQILQRDPFSVLYLGINQAEPLLADVRMRQAISHAIDKQALIDKFFISGTKQAKEFVPPSLGVTNTDITDYGYDQQKARDLLAELGYAGQAIPFTYPLNITRSYLPTPELVYAEISRQLTAVGLNIRPVPVPWSEGYLEKVRVSADHGLHLLGWNGSYRDPDNFLGSLFDSGTAEFGYSDPLLLNAIDTARTLPNGDERNEAYREISESLAQEVPGVPIAYPISALAMSDRVVSYPVSPVLDEVFNQIELSR